MSRILRAICGVVCSGVGQAAIQAICGMGLVVTTALAIKYVNSHQTIPQRIFCYRMRYWWYPTAFAYSKLSVRLSVMCEMCPEIGPRSAAIGYVFLRLPMSPIGRALKERISSTAFVDRFVSKTGISPSAFATFIGSNESLPHDEILAITDTVLYNLPPSQRADVIAHIQDIYTKYPELDPALICQVDTTALEATIAKMAILAMRLVDSETCKYISAAYYLGVINTINIQNRRKRDPELVVTEPLDYNKVLVMRYHLSKLLSNPESIDALAGSMLTINYCLDCATAFVESINPDETCEIEQKYITMVQHILTPLASDDVPYELLSMIPSAVKSVSHSNFSRDKQETYALWLIIGVLCVNFAAKTGFMTLYTTPDSTPHNIPENSDWDPMT